MRRFPIALACLAVLCLPACGAGHPGDEGRDNRWTGPELAIQVPAHGTTVRTEQPRLQFHLRALSKADVATVWFSIDGGPFDIVEDPTTWVPVLEPLAPGTHIVRAYVGDKDGLPMPCARGTATGIFHVQFEREGTMLGGPTADHGHKDAEGMWTPYDPRNPSLVVVPRPTGRWVLVSGATLDGEAWRVLVTTPTGENVLGAEAPHGALVQGEVARIQLQQRDGDGWTAGASAHATWTPPAPKAP